MITPEQMEGLRLLVTPFQTTWFNATHHRVTPEPSQGVACCDVVNRGATYSDGKLFFNTLDDNTIALDAETGKALWKTNLGDINTGETITMAPLCAPARIPITFSIVRLPSAVSAVGVAVTMWRKPSL